MTKEPIQMELKLNNMINTVFNEPCLDTLKKMQDKSIDCVISSPPYWQLRDYGYEGQWGLEPTFKEYLEHLWQMMDEIYRVLKDGGTCWINLGDTYNGLKYGNTSNKGYKENQIIDTFKKEKDENIKNKSLILIPHRFAIGCIDRGWIMRNDIIWAKRNGMPESVTDRFSKKHEYIFFMTKSEKYYFNLDAIRDKNETQITYRDKKSEKYGKETDNFSDGLRRWGSEIGKNPGSVSDFWDIPTKPSSSNHYASYNTDLIKKPILAGCPEGGVIYDPFMGTGTTAIAALRANRSFIGSEMSTEYVKIFEQSIKSYLMQTKMF
jgi:site-specific DNA-methyltransferase (adenine-specific)